ncbi:MAG: tetratricopeptide repeat protein, partial [Chloroflexota bacterium]
MAYANKPDATRPRAIPLGSAGTELADRAVSLAGSGQWTEAATLNLEMLKHHPKDISTLNRLGKCLTEMGRIKEAIATYERALQLDRQNDIARKNLERLSVLAEAAVAVDTNHSSVSPRNFIADPATSTTTTLQGVADPDALAAVAPGAELELRAEHGSLQVFDRQGRSLGSLEPRLAQRLLALITGGNVYGVALASTAGGAVRVIVHETFRHPSQANKTSFPAREAVSM